MATIPRIQPELVLKHRFPDAIFEYTERDVALYALGVGAARDNPLDPVELQFVHCEGPKPIKVLPTFTQLYPVRDVLDSIDGMHYDGKLLLHGEQYTEIYKPQPTRAQIRRSTRLCALHDTGKAAIVELEVLNHDEKTEDLLTLNRYTIVLRGAGGFSASSQRFSYSARTTFLRRTTADPNSSAQPEGAPDFVCDDQMYPAQTLIYRLSGDYHIIHSDPVFAAEAGFKEPILHGLCTVGHAVCAIIRLCCNGEPTRVLSVQARFLSPVYPGQKFTTEMWLDALQSRVLYKTKADGKDVLAGTVLITTPPQSRL